MIHVLGGSMTDSILKTVKNYVNVNNEDDVFDDELILDINSTFLTLNQIGAGPEKPFTISDDTSVWSDFMTNIDDVSAIKSYVCMRVRRMFDPPTSGSLDNALKELIAEYEWRINIAVDQGVKEEGDG